VTALLLALALWLAAGAVWMRRDSRPRRVPGLTERIEAFTVNPDWSEALREIRGLPETRDRVA
jgi:hypothetical protein